jgi:hypothetical protein
MKTSETNPSDWLLLAEERLTAADTLFHALGGTLSCIELLQESIERYLKGYLISKGWELRKIHSLSTLLDHAVHYDAEFKSHSDLCENLTAQFWAQHYPGDDLSEVGEDYPQLRSQAADLIRLIKERLR